MRPALRTILVVDDDESILGFVVRILKNANFNVLSAPAGSDALHLAATTSSRIDLLVSDVDMPHMCNASQSLPPTFPR